MDVHQDSRFDSDLALAYQGITVVSCYRIALQENSYVVSSITAVEQLMELHPRFGYTLRSYGGYAGRSAPRDEPK